MIPRRLSDWNYAAAASGIVNTTTAVTIKAAEAGVPAAVSGYRNYISSIQVAHDVLGAVTELVIRDGAGGTVLWRTKLQTAAVEAGAGAPIEFNPPLKTANTNTLLEVATLTAVTGGVYVNAQGFVGP